MSLSQSLAGPWRVTGCSVRGFSHVRSGLENQDAIGWIPADGTGSRAVLSVADGHGSPGSFRSAAGARLAVEVSHGLAAELLSAAPARPELSWVKDRLEQEVPRRIVREWRARVEDHLSGSPFTEEELALVAERAGPKGRELVKADPYLAYGTTLLTAVAVESFAAFWQIGDGDVLTVSAAGGAGRPVPGDERLIGIETTSLCSADAWRLFRVAVLGTPPPVILVSTDGFANSFGDDAGFFRFGSDILRMLVTDGFGAVSGRLEGWLREMTETGSGDDISLGVLCRPGALPSSSPEFPVASAAGAAGRQRSGQPRAGRGGRFRGWIRQHRRSRRATSPARCRCPRRGVPGRPGGAVVTGQSRVVVVVARCSRDRGRAFGVRCEWSEGASWSAAWAFALRESAAAREGYGQSVEGGLSMDAGYPGCPSCERGGLAVCGSCGGASCWGGEPERSCPWCGTRFRVDRPITHMRAGGDR